MEPYGDYELEGSIGWGANANFFSARAVNQPCEAQLVLRIARTSDATATERALRSAAEQQAALSAGCRRLAPILGSFVDQRGRACTASVRYANSLADFLDAGGGVDAEILREWVGGILAALIELAAKARRSHGNITAGNTLLDASGQPCLTDLAPHSTSIADDLHAVGTLIYQLVRRAKRVGFLVPPLDPSPEWIQAFGDEADHWREFTNRLLTRNRHPGPEALIRASEDLKHLARLHPAAPRPKPVTASDVEQIPEPLAIAPARSRRGIAAMLAVFVVGSGIGGWAWWNGNDHNRKNDRTTPTPPPVTSFPLDRFQKFVTGKRLTSLSADPQLNALLDRIGKNLTPKTTPDDVQLLLGNWPVPGQLESRAAAWGGQPFDWPNLARDLKRAAKIDILDESHPLEDQFSAAIEANRRAGEIENIWREIQSSLTELNGRKDRLIPDFSAWATGEIRAASRLETAQSAATATREKLGSARKFVDENWSRLHSERFAKEAAAVLQMPDEIGRSDWPGQWERAARRFLRPPQEQRNGWLATLNGVKPKIARRPTAEQTAWRDKEQNARARIAEMLDTPDEVNAFKTSLKEFGLLRDPMDEALEAYHPMFDKFQTKAKKVTTAKEAQAQLDQFKTETATLLPAFLAKVQLASQLIRLQDSLKLSDSLTLPSLMAKGWKLESTSGKDAAVYSFGDIRIPFLRIGETKSAMSAVEMPLAFGQYFPEYVNSPHPPGPLARPTPTNTPADWLWEGPIAFLRQQAKEPNPLAKNYYAPGVQPHDGAGNAWPLTWISGTKAKDMAEKLGGRLPTKSEWEKAVALAQPKISSSLRGEAWKKQIEFIDTWKDLKSDGRLTAVLGRASYEPDVGSFSKTPGLNGSDAADYKKDINKHPESHNDTILWLHSVYGAQKDAPAKFLNFYGNAAEWLSDGDKIFYIAGGSAVSPPSLSIDEPLPFSNSDGAYFDVTFRLVANVGDAPGGGPGLEEFKKAVADLAPPPAN